MQSEPSTRYIHSVSDLLYTTDEIEFLLDDIRDLEPKNYKPEDIQDFEIAGSRTGALSSAGGAAECTGAASECAGGCECESPLGTVNSWDSHSHYRRNPPSPDLSLYSGVILYCDHTHLRTSTGFFRLLLLATSIACLACLCTSGTLKVGLFMLPSIGRIRFMMFITLLSMFTTCLLLFLDISHIVYLFPFNWGKVNAYFYVSLSVLFLIASSLLFHMIFSIELPKWTHHQLLVTGCLGYVCSIESAIISVIQKCQMAQYEPVEEDLSFHLQERPFSPKDSPQHNKVNQTTHNYKPIVNYSNPSVELQLRRSSYARVVVEDRILAQVVPSTSKQDPMNYLDDIQPCSSKSGDPYRVV